MSNKNKINLLWSRPSSAILCGGIVSSAQRRDNFLGTRARFCKEKRPFSHKSQDMKKIVVHYHVCDCAPRPSRRRSNRRITSRRQKRVQTVFATDGAVGVKPKSRL